MITFFAQGVFSSFSRPFKSKGTKYFNTLKDLKLLLACSCIPQETVTICFDWLLEPFHMASMKRVNGFIACIARDLHVCGFNQRQWLLYSPISIGDIKSRKSCKSVVLKNSCSSFDYPPLLEWSLVLLSQFDCLRDRTGAVTVDGLVEHFRSTCKQFWCHVENICKPLVW